MRPVATDSEWTIIIPLVASLMGAGVGAWTAQWIAARNKKNEERLKDLGITKRELEILELIAHGMSNREIAEKLFVSENTVKTHSSRLFDKLSAKRRTQAVQIGKQMGLIR